MRNTTCLLATTEAAILTLTLNRPQQHNALNNKLINRLTQQLKNAEADARIRVVILKGQGQSFCAGADLRAMQMSACAPVEQNKTDARALGHLLRTLDRLSKPTIACVQGAAYGGGVGLLACCDIAIATPETRFCFPETKLGILPAIISPFIVRALGARAAKHYFLTGEIFDGAEAQRLGLVQRIVSESELSSAGLQIAAQLLKNGPRALQATKGLINTLQASPLAESHSEHTVELIAEIRASAEGREGVTAFLEKRKPRWLD